MKVVRSGLFGTAALVTLACYPAVEQDRNAAASNDAANGLSAGSVAPERHASSGFLYGRVTADGGTYEGRLRWGQGDLEATWTDLFDGHKDENPWAAYAPPGFEEPRARLELFGIEFGPDPSPLARQFLAHFGDVARVEAYFAEVRVILKSGTAVTLDRFAAGDIDDGVRVWDNSRGVVDLDTRQIRTIEFRPTPPLPDAPDRLHGVVHTRAGAFSGFIQWNQRDSVATDTLDGRTAAGLVNVRYDTIRTIARDSRDAVAVTLLDGQVLTLSGTRDAGREHRGIYVDDARYGRVLIPWDRFERVEFSPGNGGPAYADFRPGRALAGSVTARDGRRCAGRLVYDLDESETAETLDVSIDGVSYAIPFAQIAAIAPRGRAGAAAEPMVVLRSGEELSLERSGDVGERNAGLLIFAAGRERPEHVQWADIERIDFDR